MNTKSFTYNQMRLPAEWEHQRAIMLTWPHEGTDWKPYLGDIEQTYVELVEAISAYEDVVIAAQNPEAVRLLLQDIEPQRLHIWKVKNDDTWARDHGPITLLGKKTDEQALLDFRFNGWGEKFSAENDNMITRQLAQQGAFKGPIVDCNDFVLEGGSIETDGHGTLFTTAQCLLAPHRNQPLDKEEIEKILSERLCCQRVLWLHHGEVIGDDTDGHIDTIVRIAPNDTLLYVSCEPEDPQYEDFKALEDELKTLTTTAGKPYRLLPLPTPRPIFDDGERLPATYANYLVINNAVIVPTYGQADNDMDALDTIGEAFPDREIIAIDARTIIRQHGSIHCLTMQLY